MFRAGWLSEHRRTTDGAAHPPEVDVNPTYEVSGAGSEHVHKSQRERLTNQPIILHRETQSHDVTISTSLVGIGSRSGTRWQ